MKKKITAAVLAAMATAVFVGCSSEAVGYSGAYWNDQPNSQTILPIYEKLTYDVTKVNGEDIGLSSYKRAGFELKISSGSYETELFTSDDNSEYIYKTSLKIKGAYIYGNKSYEVDDYTQTETHFKGISDNLAPISSVKKLKNVTPSALEPQSENDFYEIEAEISVNYSGENADITSTIKNLKATDENAVTERTATIKGYNKQSFIEDDIMIFAFRAFEINGSFSKAFTTLDASAEKVKNVKCEITGLAAAGGKDVPATPVTLKNVLTDDKLRDTIDFTTYGVTFSTTGGEAQAFRYVYYATNKVSDGVEVDNEHRHRPVRIYQPLIFSSGYLAFDLKTVRTKK